MKVFHKNFSNLKEKRRKENNVKEKKWKELQDQRLWRLNCLNPNLDLLLKNIEMKLGESIKKYEAFSYFKGNGFVLWEISLQGILFFATKKSMTKCFKLLHNWL